MRKSKFHLIHTNCRRCGKPLMTGSRSLFGMDEAKKQLDRLCGDCITPEEKDQLHKLRPIIHG